MINPILYMQATSRCEFSDPLDDIDVTPIPASSDRISLFSSFTTATVAVTVESFSFLFVGRVLTANTYTVSGVSETVWSCIVCLMPFSCSVS